MRRRPLPSLAALAALEAAIRTRSFVAAASQLHVTPTAISHQIRSLEDTLGVRLFVRRNRRVEPTGAALAALADLQTGFAFLDRAVDQLREKAVEEHITICAEPAFAARWLVPRLLRFQRRHAWTRIRLQTSMGTIDTARFKGISPASFTHAGVDLSIRLGLGAYHGLFVERLLDLTVSPVLSPSLLTGRRLPSDPRALLGLPLLHDGTRYRATQTWDWKEWFGRQGVEIDGAPSLSFGSLALALDAAAAGQGVALGPEPLVQADVRQGKLVAPFDYRLPLDFGYYLVWPKEPQSAGLSELRTWLLEEAQHPCADIGDPISA